MAICNKCHGNGYLYIRDTEDEEGNVVITCPKCNGSGEVDDSEIE